MNRRSLIWTLTGLLAVFAAVLGYKLAQPSGMKSRNDKSATAEVKEEAVEQACASNATYARLKEVLFEEAIRVRKTDPANLDLLAANSVVRMENPVVKSRDDDLNVTVCSGRFVLELPPGAERGFGGERRLVADIEYAAQAAVDGSGLVYRMSGAEPIVYKLAVFDLGGQQLNRPQPVETADAGETAAPAPADEPPAPKAAPAPAPQRPPVSRPAPEPVKTAEQPRPQPAPTRAAAVNPSFNCRYARTRGEQMVCGSSRLAAQDRAMSSLYYSAMAQANARARSALRQTRNRFLAYRDRCPNEACVADAYEGRMREIRDIMADLN